MMQTPEAVEIYWHHRVALLALSVGLVVLVLELVRRGYLKERYALLWLATSAAGLAIGAFPGAIVWFSQQFKFQFLTVIVALTFFFTLALVLTFSTILSRLSERNRKLTQEVALLKRSVEELERDRDE